MKFSCNHCGKQFVTQEEVVAGRVYRVPCRCGNSIELRVDASRCDRGTPTPCRPSRAAPPPLPVPRARGVRAPTASATPASAPVALPTFDPRHSLRAVEIASVLDDLFARLDRPEPALVPSGNARREPDTSPDEVDERTGPYSVSVDWARRTLRARAFVTGFASGGLAASFMVVALVAAGSTFAPVVVAPAPSGARTEVAAAVMPAKRKAPRAASARRAPSTPAVPVRAMIGETASPGQPSPALANPEPEASPTKTAEMEGAETRSDRRGAIKPVDSTPDPARVDPEGPATEDAEVVADARDGSAESDAAADSVDGAQSEDEAKAASVPLEQVRDGPDATAPEPGSATEAFATARSAFR